MKVRIVRPYVHRKLKLSNEAGTTDEGRDTSLFAVFGRTFRQGWTVGASPPDHFAPLHVHRGVARVHAPNVCTQGTGIAVWVHVRVGEIIGALGICAKEWIIFLWREDQWGTTPPSSHQLRCD